MSVTQPGLLKKVRFYTIALPAICFFTCTANAQTLNMPVKPRVVITADPELDDNNSLIRFLMYSSDVKVEGLIYASSGYHWKGDGKGTKWFVPGREYARFGLDTCPCTSWRWADNERFIDNAVDAYAKAYPNLKVHNSNYPAPDELKSKIRYGNIEFDGDISKNSPGSDLIKSLMLDDKPGQLYITAWGGQSTIARALKSIQEQYENTTQWDAIKKKISHKVVLLPSGDQDDTYAKYIKPNWPGIEYRQFRGGPNYSYGAQLHAKPADSVYLTPAWMQENITSRGPLGALYRVWGDGKQMVKGDKMDYFGLSGYTNEQLRSMGYAVWMPVQAKGSWLGEGDDFTFMNMLGNGLRAYEEGDYGGWGGRTAISQSPETSPFLISDTSQQAMVSALGSINKNTGEYPDFFPAAQNDFAARLKWAVTSKYTDANHAPVVTIEGPLQVLASPGEKIRLNGLATDPDGDGITLSWWQLPAGSYPHAITLSNPASQRMVITIPKDAVAGQTIHIILEATDNGSPSLTSYQRVIITIRAGNGF
ncbi:MAG TPA: nucleoside hydrolase-like domain-containing protein [Chitinophagaceae bacterium]|nr:nucleoside hydrolase-like domain-containing protein [Chitinophagaceae bacterium]